MLSILRVKKENYPSLLSVHHCFLMTLHTAVLSSGGFALPSSHIASRNLSQNVLHILELFCISFKLTFDFFARPNYSYTLHLLRSRCPTVTHLYFSSVLHFFFLDGLPASKVFSLRKGTNHGSFAWTWLENSFHTCCYGLDQTESQKVQSKQGRCESTPRVEIGTLSDV